MIGINIKLFLIPGFFLLLALQNSEIHGEEFLQLLTNQSPILINGSMSEILKWAEKVERDQGYDAAVEMYTGLIHYFETTSGAQHPQTTSLMTRLFKIHANADHPEKALPLAWKVYRQLENIHGKEHMRTVNALVNLGKIYHLSQKSKKAKEFLKRAYKLTKFHMGQNHPDTIDVLFELANVYRQDGDSDSEKPESDLDLIPDSDSNLELALRYYQKVYDVRSKDPRLGEEHESTLVTLIHMGYVLSQKGDFLEAIKIFDKVLEIRKKTLGEDHPLAQEVKNYLFHTLSKSGKTQRAKKVLGAKNYENDKGDESLFALAEGKANALVESGKHAQALEILNELYKHEILRGQGQISPKILRVLDQLISSSKAVEDFEQTVNWANVVIDLFEKQGVNQGHPKDKKEYENIVIVLMYAITSATEVYSEQNDEDKIDEYFVIASEVMEGQGQVPGQEQPIILVDKLLDLTSRVADFKTKIGKTSEAFTILNHFVDRHPRGCTTSLCGIKLMVDIALKNDDHKMMEIIALKFFSNQQQQDKNVEKLKEKVREFLVNYLFSKAIDLFHLQNYKEAFSLYKTVEKIWPEAILAQDNELTPNFLERISNAALMLNKLDEAFFYFGKIKEVFKNRLINEPEMEEKARAAIQRDISKLETFQESLKTKLKTHNFVKEKQNFQKDNLELNSNKAGKFKKTEL